MEKDLNYSELYQEYKALLTDNQSEVFNLYYLCDLSLGEISEIKGISRQGVNDTLNKTRDLLLNYEKNLKILEKKRQLTKFANSLSNESEKAELIKIIGDL
jgi:predicted DNA-binding protein YlxM (UPF0122 family)